MLTRKCQPPGKTRTLETDLGNMGSIAFPSITFTCCQYGVLKIDVCSPGIAEEVEGRIQPRNCYNETKMAAMGTVSQVVPIDE